MPGPNNEECGNCVWWSIKHISTEGYCRALPRVVLKEHNDYCSLYKMKKVSELRYEVDKCRECPFLHYNVCEEGYCSHPNIYSYSRDTKEMDDYALEKESVLKDCPLKEHAIMIALKG